MSRVIVKSYPLTSPFEPRELPLLYPAVLQEPIIHLTGIILQSHKIHRIMEIYPSEMIRDHDKYLQAQALRSSGSSIRTIAKALNISTSTASIWSRDIQLTTDQKATLNARSQNGELLRSFAHQRHLNKVENQKNIFNEAEKEILALDNDQLFLTGLALYWAEGFKNLKEQRVGFCNSDPRMIKFIMRWFRGSLKIAEEDFTLRVELNNLFKDQDDEFKSYWSQLTGVPLNQFNRSYFQMVNQIRSYPNKSNYHGTLRIRIRRSSRLLVRLRGWIEGLSLSGN
jgi:hypothetical protein